jgi:hypothetical protein
VRVDGGRWAWVGEMGFMGVDLFLCGDYRWDNSVFGRSCGILSALIPAGDVHGVGFSHLTLLLGQWFCTETPV